MSSDRTEEEVLVKAGLPVVLGGETRYVPPLTIAATRRWKSLLGERIAARWGELGGTEEWSQIAGLFFGLDDEQLDLLLAYDEARDATGKATRPGVLGGREFVEEHGTPDELYAAFKVVGTAAFPFVRDARAFPGLVKLLLEQVRENSTSGSSMSGGASPKKSTKR